MAQLNQQVTLHDVADVEAFVRSTIQKGRLRLTTDEREELVAAGMTIMVRLAKIYEPGRNGLDAAGSKFSGYAAKYLPGKLSDEWHRMQEHHRLVTVEGGERRWQYDQKPASLDAIREETGTDHIKAVRVEDLYGSDMALTLRSVLDERWPHDREITVKLGVLMGSGYRVDEAAKIIGITAEEAALAFKRIHNVRGKLKRALLVAA